MDKEELQRRAGIMEQGTNPREDDAERLAVITMKMIVDTMRALNDEDMPEAITNLNVLFQIHSDFRKGKTPPSYHDVPIA